MSVSEKMRHNMSHIAARTSGASSLPSPRRGLSARWCHRSLSPSEVLVIAGAASIPVV